MINILRIRKLKLQRNSGTCSKSHLFILANLGFELSSIWFSCQCLFRCMMPSLLLHSWHYCTSLPTNLPPFSLSLITTSSTKLTNISVSSRSLRAGNISYSSFYSQPQSLAPCMAHWRYLKTCIEYGSVTFLFKNLFLLLKLMGENLIFLTSSSASNPLYILVFNFLISVFYPYWNCF